MMNPWVVEKLINVVRGPAQIIHDSQDNLDDSALLEDESLSLIPAIDQFRL